MFELVNFQRPVQFQNITRINSKDAQGASTKRSPIQLFSCPEQFHVWYTYSGWYNLRQLTSSFSCPEQFYTYFGWLHELCKPL